MPPVGRNWRVPLPHLSAKAGDLLRAATVATALTGAGWAASHVISESARRHGMHLLAPLSLLGIATALGGGRPERSDPLAGITPDPLGIVRLPHDVAREWFWTGVAGQEGLYVITTRDLLFRPDVLRRAEPAEGDVEKSHMRLAGRLAHVAFEIDRIGRMDGDEALQMLREACCIKMLIENQNLEGLGIEDGISVVIESYLPGFSPGEINFLQRFCENGEMDLTWGEILLTVRDYRRQHLTRIGLLPDGNVDVPLIVRGMKADHASPRAEAIGPEGLMVFVPPDRAEEVARFWRDRGHPAWQTPVRFVPFYPDLAHHPTDSAALQTTYRSACLKLELRNRIITGLAQEEMESVVVTLSKASRGFIDDAAGKMPNVRLALQKRLAWFNGESVEGGSQLKCPQDFTEGFLRLMDEAGWSKRDLAIALEVAWDSDLWVPPAEQERLVGIMKNGNAAELKRLRNEVRDIYSRYFPWGQAYLHPELRGASRPVERVPRSVPTMEGDQGLRGQELKRVRDFSKKAGKAGVAPAVVESVRGIMAGLVEDREVRFRRLIRVGTRAAGFDFLVAYRPETDKGGGQLLAWLDSISLDRVKAEPETKPEAEPVPPPVLHVEVPPSSPVPLHAAPVPLVTMIPWYETDGHLQVLSDLQGNLAALGRGDYEWDRYTLALKRLAETEHFNAVVARLHGFRADPRLEPVFRREAENPNYLRTCLLALSLLREGKLSAETFVAIVNGAEVLRARLPGLAKIRLLNTLGVVLCDAVGRRRFGHRTFPYMAELDAIARRAVRPDISEITVIPAGGRKTPDLEVRTVDGRFYLVEVKSISDSLQMRDTILMGDAEHKVHQALPQLGLGADGVGEIDLYTYIRNESVEERFVPALTLRLLAMPEVRANRHLTVNVISSRRMMLQPGIGVIPT